MKKINFTEQTNIHEFSYDFKSLDDFFTTKYDLEFNNKIYSEIFNQLPKRLANSREIVFVENPEPNKRFSPIQLNPIEFFNLFYHELNHIIDNKVKPLSSVPRLDSIKLPYIDRLYLYAKLIEKLEFEADEYLKLIVLRIKEQYSTLFDRYFGLKINNNPLKTAEDTIALYNSIIESINDVAEIYKSLSAIKNLENPLHFDPHINSFLREKWLIPQIQYFKELLDSGITTICFHDDAEPSSNSYLEKTQKTTRYNASITINEIALLHFYRGMQITRQNSNSIAQNYGMNSGEKLFQRYTHYTSRANRIGTPHPFTQKRLENKIALFEKVFNMLEHDKQLIMLGELSILKSKKDEL